MAHTLRSTACPANAIDPVKQLVRRSEGYVADNCWADGIAEALAFYQNLCLGRIAPAEPAAQSRTMRPV